MSRSNDNKPFYVDVGSSIVRMNKEAEIDRPLRNCDVGTAEEQAERHDKFCASSIAECGGVITNDCIRCFARWAQMPYEEVK